MNTLGMAFAGLVVCAAGFAQAKGSTVYIDETFDSYDAGRLRAVAPLCRVEQVSVEKAPGTFGTGKVARYNDSSPDDGGALEYSVGARAPGRMYIEFDLFNNEPGELDSKMALIFSVAQWDASRNLSLNANAKRAFAIEFYQSGYYRTLLLRVGASVEQESTYDMNVPQHVQVWVNDHETEMLSYEKPDTGEAALLNPDSFVVWINKELVGFDPAGILMQKSISAGDAVLGRVGFGSPSHGLVDFLLDNFHVEDPTGASAPATSALLEGNEGAEVTPDRMAGADTLQYRKGEAEMNLFVYRPEGWAATDRRSALIYFFGGGWTRGTPLNSASWARWAAEQGMVGIAPDYRTENRFGTSPLSAVADGRVAFNWVVEHASRLGIDPERIVVGGSSAGGHIALWTAIAQTPPGSSLEEAARVKPAALFLSSAVTDTSVRTGYAPQRFGDDAEALSPYHQLDSAMPPILMFHACDDERVSYSSAVALYKKMKTTGNECELISVPRGGHGYSSAYPEWKEKVKSKVETFLKKRNLLPAVS
ncbi:alpha/beta hydrolase [Pontiellaceae bacterium B12219]|nr:alpha/beta hydrolase [Pontiellaceae bacterium B12219]